jgi:hypothetical protein
MAEEDQDGKNTVEEEYSVLGGSEGPAAGKPLSTKRLAALAGGPALALLVILLPAPSTMQPEAWRLVGLALWMVVCGLARLCPFP